MVRASLCSLVCSLAVVVVGGGGCGDDGATVVADAAPDAPPDAPTDAPVDAPGPFTLVSAALVDGTMFARDNTCNGANRSLPLEWTGTPIGTQSFAVVLTDTSNNLIHWVIYDIPAGVTALPEGVEKTYLPSNPAGAHQAKSYDQQVTGYLGPCPPAMHTYKVVLYALDVAALPGTNATTMRPALQALILEHDLASLTITGTYTQS